MKPIDIAITLPRRRADVDNGWRWAEYRLTCAADGQYCVEQRYVRTDGDTRDDQPWEPWTFGTTKAEAVADGMGDTAYERAMSLHDLHAKAAARCRVERALHDAKYFACREAEQARRRLAEFKSGANKRFERRAKGKTAAESERVKAKLLAELQPEHDRLTAAVKESEAKAKAASTALDRHQKGR